MEPDSTDLKAQEYQHGQAYDRDQQKIEYKKLDDLSDSYAKTSDDYEIQDPFIRRKDCSYENNLITNDESNNISPEDTNNESDLYHNLQPNIQRDNQQEHIDSLLKSISSIDFLSLEKILGDIPASLDLTKVVDSQNGYTLLHLAVFKDSERMILMLCKHIMTKQTGTFEKKKKKMKNWINTKTEGKEGFTALHLASFNGNLSIVRFLEKHGADIYVESNFCLNALHIAAQGNQPTCVVYFLNKNFDVNCRDRVNGTPLHWACYSGADTTVAYLLANDAYPNAQDKDGHTPLHLAIKSSDVVKNTRLVKQLLFNGADRNLTNNEGSSPMDYAKDVAVHHVSVEIRKSLAEPKYCSFLLLTQPLTKMKKELHTAISFVVLMTLLLVVLYFYIFPFTGSIVWNCVLGALFGSSVIFWILSAFKDPGYLKKSDKLEFITLVEKLDPTCLCPKCKIIRTPRSRHCTICDKCVERFDHHCPWINNCIGTGNHGIFIIFLINIFSFLLLILFQIITNHSIYKGIKFLLLMTCGFFWLLISILLLKQIFVIIYGEDLNRKEPNRPRDNSSYHFSDKSFGDSEAQAALLRNVSIDSSLDNRNKGKCRNLLSVLKGGEMKDQYQLFLKNMKRAGTNCFESPLHDRTFY
ncbi:unnamed protein product [Moneuplotes crassus]|uniref:Palmitoyltransferase n=1 Tax=Euplotes crassus TaxID=5936 RepID=A0AAD1X8U7_EUPCR|nr:unnamed protein product [Moneuplotes crassus]